MKRFVSVWLPAWPIERLSRADPDAVPPRMPLALVEVEAQARVVTAVSAAAAEQGVRIGMGVSDARAILPALRIRPAEPVADASVLRRLARWCSRYGPSRNIDEGSARFAGEHGLWIDVSGVAHLFGGEAGLLADLAGRLRCFRLTARLGLADTYGAAHALARYAHASPALAPAGGTCAALAALPVAALRLTHDTLRLLNRLGLRRIGDLYGLPRPALERRFRDDADAARGRSGLRRDAPALAAAVLARLDMALGAAAEPLRPLGVKPELAARRSFSEPLISSAGIEMAVAELAADLCAALDARGLGARRIRLSLYRADGSFAALEAGMSAPCRSAPHMLRLLAERLANIDAGFGIDVASLEALRVAPQPHADVALPALGHAAARGDAARLVDVLAGRLGEERVVMLAPRASHLPERSEIRIAAASRPPDACAAPWPLRQAGGTRPPLLFAVPEPIAVMAEVPEGPPRHFTWRRLAHRVARAEGPQRIAPEWWRHLPPTAFGETGAAAADAGGERPAAARGPRTRDYYRVEAEGGGRYWIFRDGLYGDEAAPPPRWFLHGLFD